MRKGHTEAEGILWEELRNGQLGEKFRRQHPVDAFIVDFICLQKSLVVEVDGGYQTDAEQQKYDAERTRILQEIGFTVIRFTNEEVTGNTKEVIKKIAASLKEQTSKQAKANTSIGYSNPQTAISKVTDGGAPLAIPLWRDGEGPGVRAKAGLRETSTMPGYAGSSWYFLRYMDPHNDKTFCDRKVSDYWNQVDVYVGGTEHAVGHLLYSRLWTKVLFDLGHIGYDEPYKRLVNQGMITGKSYFFTMIRLPAQSNTEGTEGRTYLFGKDGAEKWLESKNSNYVQTDFRFKYGHRYVDLNGKLTKETLDRYKTENDFPYYENIEWINSDGQQYVVLREEGEKMSKSKFNVDNPDDLVDKYGADTFRMYEMFLGPVEASKPWDTKGIEGVHRFLKKLWRLFYDEMKGKVWKDEKAGPEELKILHRTIKKIEEDTERFSFNTAVSTFMICVNDLNDLKCHKKEVLEQLLVLLTPYAPHIAEELWHLLGNAGSVLDASYPVFDAKHVTESSKEYPVSINGKVRTSINIALDAAQPEVEQIVLANETVQKWLEGKAPKKIIYVKNKMVNVVV
jgi:leucyl-tRNA synthetase